MPKSSVLLTLTLVRSFCERSGCAAGIDATAAMAATAILIALATPAASITFPWTAQQRTPAKACITSAKRGDLVEALGQLEAAREARDPQLCEAWTAVLDGLAAGGAPRLRFFEAMLHDGFGWADLPRATASKLEGRAPPPALSSGYDAVAPIIEPLPELWVSVTKRVEDSHANHGEALDAARLNNTPVLLKGAFSAPQWTARSLARSFPAGAVCRVAPSAAVSFCRESHPDVVDGVTKALSRALVVSPDEIEARLAGEAASPFVYPNGEHLYVQALAPPSLLSDVDLSFLGNFGARDACRVWACRGGVYSPLHYDAQDSHLLQASGSKRVVLWPSTTLEALRPYDASSPLARRLRVDVRMNGMNAAEAALRRGDERGLPDGKAGPSGEEAYEQVARGAVEAIIEPGDARFFPADWAHHIESRGDLSVALSLREVDGALVGT